MAIHTLPPKLITDQHDLAKWAGAARGDTVDARNVVAVNDSCHKDADNYTAIIRNWSGIIDGLRGYGMMKRNIDDRTKCYQGKYGNRNGGFLTLKGVGDITIQNTFCGRDIDTLHHCSHDGLKLNSGNVEVENSCWLGLFDDVSDNHSGRPLSFDGCLLHSMMGWAVEDGGSGIQQAVDCIWYQFQILNTNKHGGHPIRGGTIKWQGKKTFFGHDIVFIVFDGNHRAWRGGWENFVKHADLSGECLLLDCSHLSKWGSSFKHDLPRGMKLVQGDEAAVEAERFILGFIAGHDEDYDERWPSFNWRKAIHNACYEVMGEGAADDDDQPGDDEDDRDERIQELEDQVEDLQEELEEGQERLTAIDQWHGKYPG